MSDGYGDRGCCSVLGTLSTRTPVYCFSCGWSGVSMGGLFGLIVLGRNWDQVLRDPVRLVNQTLVNDPMVGAPNMTVSFYEYYPSVPAVVVVSWLVLVSCGLICCSALFEMSFQGTVPPGSVVACGDDTVFQEEYTKNGVVCCVQFVDQVVYGILFWLGLWIAILLSAEVVSGDALNSFLDEDTGAEQTSALRYFGVVVIFVSNIITFLLIVFLLFRCFYGKQEEEEKYIDDPEDPRFGMPASTKLYVDDIDDPRFGLPISSQGRRCTIQ